MQKTLTNAEGFSPVGDANSVCIDRIFIDT